MSNQSFFNKHRTGLGWKAVETAVFAVVWGGGEAVVCLVTGSGGCSAGFLGSFGSKLAVKAVVGYGVKVGVEWVSIS